MLKPCISDGQGVHYLLLKHQDLVKERKRSNEAGGVVCCVLTRMVE